MKIERNDWESAFFGRGVYSLVFGELCSRRGGPMCPPANEELFSNCENDRLFGRTHRSAPTKSDEGRLIQAKVRSAEIAKIRFLQQSAFHFIEGEITFCLEFAKNAADLTPCTAQIATESDLPALKTLVANAFSNSRFRPPYFTREENQKFYQHWLENAVKGEFDDICFVLKQGEKLQGAVSVRCRGEVAKLGLLAVAPDFQRQGIGKKLLTTATAWAQAQHAKSLEITTQMSNIPAIQLYQSAGAKIAATNYWFYR